MAGKADRIAGRAGRAARGHFRFRRGGAKWTVMSRFKFIGKDRLFWPFVQSGSYRLSLTLVRGPRSCALRVFKA
jgi:hypothetical protein